jgi:hypothetical protein
MSENDVFQLRGALLETAPRRRGLEGSWLGCQDTMNFVCLHSAVYGEPKSG